ncbi:MAG TPA: hypothetical protein VGF59_09665 [Bryobacteraceae bacterium]
MPTRSSRRLAGCIVIEIAVAAFGVAADLDYSAGSGSAPHARAIALEDRRGGRVVFLEADFPVTRTIADATAVELLKRYELTRAGILVRGASAGQPYPAELLAAAAAAFREMEPVRIQRTGDTLSLSGARCVGTLFPVVLEGCEVGPRVTGPIRAAFSLVEPEHGLRRRADPVPGYPVQAIAIGRQTAVLALAGDAPVDSIRADLGIKGVIVVARANDSMPVPDDPRIRLAIRQILTRIGR